MKVDAESVIHFLLFKLKHCYKEYIMELNTAVEQFISHFNRNCHRENDPFYFGEEIEYMLVTFDGHNKTVSVNLFSFAVLEKLWQNPNQSLVWKPEYVLYMLESSPEKPYHGLITSPSDIEQDMKNRRRDVMECTSTDEHLLAIASFPRLGDVKNSDSTHSHPDDLVANTPRYQKMKSCTSNTLKEIQRSVEVKLPVFSDSKTEQHEILMDSLTYGLGCCSIQITMQAPNLQACMNLYDQLVNIAPVMLALSAASPIHNGYMTDFDTRWKALTELPISRKSEMEANNGIAGCRRLNRSESVHCYACPENQHLNDVDVEVDDEIFQRLKEEDCYPGLALYIANLFCRKYPSLTSDTDDENLKHYLNVQSSNWQTVRIKVPNKTSGWTVEFRPMDVQVTDFENTAYTVFVMLLSKVIMEYKLTLAVPISKVNENIDKACEIDAVKSGMFYMPRNLITGSTLKDTPIFNGSILLIDNFNIRETEIGVINQSKEKEFEYYSVKHIVCGGERFVGLLPIIRHYLSSNDIKGYDKYLNLIEDRAKGTIPTTARAIRDFVLSHPCYHSNSMVNEQVQYDLLQTIAKHTVDNTVMGNTMTSSQ